MDATRRYHHNFLGLNLSFSEDKVLQIGMKECLEKALKDFGEMLILVSSPTKKNLFDADEKSHKLKDCDRNTFHSIVMLLMCVVLKGRKYTQLPAK